MEKRKALILIGIVSAVVLFVVLGFVAGLNIYYSNKWFPGTTVNGMDVSGQTIDETVKKLEEAYKNYKLSIKGRDNGNMEILGEDIKFSINPESKCKELFEGQHSSFTFFPKGKNLEGYYDTSFDEKKLNKLLDDSVFIKGDKSYKIIKPKNAYATFDKDINQYICKEEVAGNMLKKDLFFKAVKKALQEGRINIDITDSKEYPDIYEVPGVTSENEEIKNEIEACNDVAVRYISWNMGEGDVVKITPLKISKWIKYENEKIKYDQEKVADWVESFCLKYKTVGKTRSVTSHNGQKVKVTGGDYGWQMDYKTTLKQALEGLNEKIDKKKIQAYIANPDEKTRKEITIKKSVKYLNTAFRRDYENFAIDWDEDNYTEVSIADQMVYVFRNGKVKFSCRCITGRPVKDRITPTGTFFIKEHRDKYTLTGADYETPVENWVRITWTGTGFHPATWQPWGSWSKNLYKTRGSHGCVNLAPTDAKTIYDLVKYREAVFIH